MPRWAAVACGPLRGAVGVAQRSGPPGLIQPAASEVAVL